MPSGCITGIHKKARQSTGFFDGRCGPAETLQVLRQLLQNGRIFKR